MEYEPTDREQHSSKEHDDFGKLRAFIWNTVNKIESPGVEMEVEEICRCALRGGYKLDLEKFFAAHGAFVCGYDGDFNPMN